MPVLQIQRPGGGGPVSVSVDDSFTKLSPADQNRTVDEIAAHLGAIPAPPQGYTLDDPRGSSGVPPTGASDAWASLPVPGSAADATADAALMAKGSPQGGSAALPPLPPGYTLDRQPWLDDPVVPQGSGAAQPNADQPWLNAPIVKRAAGAHPDEPWLDAPIVSPAGGADASQPWLNDPTVPQDTSYGSAFQQGLHDAASGLGSTLGVLSGDVGWKGGQAAGQALQNAIPAPANYSSAGGDMVSKLKSGKLLGALEDLPRAAVEGAPAVGGGLLAAAATPEVLGGAAVGAGAYGALSAFGQDAQARAAANGHAQPTAGDQLAAAPTALAQGGLNAVGLGKVPGVSSLIAKSPAVLRGLAAGGVDAAGQAASNVVGQVGTTAGTKQGLTVDPDQAAAAALQGAGARGGLMAAGGLAGAAGSAAKAGVAGLGQRLATLGLPPMSDDQAASAVRIDNSLQAGGPGPMKAKVAALQRSMGPQLGALISQARDAGLVSDQDARTVLLPALSQARVSTASLDPGLMDQLRGLDIEPTLKATLVNGLTDLDNVSTMAAPGSSHGPFATLGGQIARVGIVGSGLLDLVHGNPLEGLVKIGAGTTGQPGGHSYAFEAGRQIGGLADSVLGTNAPPLLLQSAKARAQAAAAGYDTTGTASGPIRDLSGTLSNLQAGQGGPATMPGVITAAPVVAPSRPLPVPPVGNGSSPRPIKPLTANDNGGGTSAQRTPVVAGSSTAPLPTPLLAMAQARQQMALLEALSGAGVRPDQLVPVPPQDAQAIADRYGPEAQGQSVGGAQGQPQGAGGPAGGQSWRQHMMGVLVGRGVPVAPDTISNAISTAAQSGNINGKLADYLQSYDGFIPDHSLTFQHIANAAMAGHGLQPQPVVAPIRNLQRWQAAGQSYQRLGETLQTEAAAEGDKHLALAIARIRAVTSAAAKQAVAQQLEASRAGDPVASARAKRLLVPELLRGQ